MGIIPIYGLLAKFPGMLKVEGSLERAHPTRRLDWVKSGNGDKRGAL